MSIATFNGGLVTCSGQLVTVGPAGTGCLPMCTATGVIPGCPPATECPTSVLINIGLEFVSPSNGITTNYTGMYPTIRIGPVGYSTELLSVNDSIGRPQFFKLQVACVTQIQFPTTLFFWGGSFGVFLSDGRPTAFGFSWRQDHSLTATVCRAGGGICSVRSFLMGGLWEGSLLPDCPHMMDAQCTLPQAVTLYGEKPSPGICILCSGIPKSRGFGDTLAKALKPLRFKPCNGCRDRQDQLNELIPYQGITV